MLYYLIISVSEYLLRITLAKLANIHFRRIATLEFDPMEIADPARNRFTSS